jgi:hypothetical protein
MRHVIVPLCGATVFSVVVMMIWPDLGLNLFADVLALWFALFAIDIALEKGRAEANRPAHRAMVDDLLRLRRPIDHVLSLMLAETAGPADLPHLSEVAKGHGDVATILARKRLMTSPAPVRQLGWINGPEISWWDAIRLILSPTALRLDILIARYVSVANAETLAALQGLETSAFADFLRGQLSFDDDIVLEIFWRSLIQSLAKLDAELALALEQHDDRGAIVGPPSYLAMAMRRLADQAERAALDP